MREVNLDAGQRHGWALATPIVWRNDEPAPTHAVVVSRPVAPATLRFSTKSRGSMSLRLGSLLQYCCSNSLACIALRQLIFRSSLDLDRDQIHDRLTLWSM